MTFCHSVTDFTSQNWWVTCLPAEMLPPWILPWTFHRPSPHAHPFLVCLLLHWAPNPGRFLPLRCRSHHLELAGHAFWCNCPIPCSLYTRSLPEPPPSQLTAGPYWTASTQVPAMPLRRGLAHISLIRLLIRLGQVQVTQIRRTETPCCTNGQDNHQKDNSQLDQRLPNRQIRRGHASNWKSRPEALDKPKRKQKRMSKTHIQQRQT